MRAADLVGVAEIAQRAGVKPNTVSTWRLRQGDTFPAPLVELAIGPVWQWSKVERWLQRDKRSPGRPRRRRRIRRQPDGASG